MASSVLVLQPTNVDSIQSSYGYDGREDIEIYLTTSGPNASVTPLKVCIEDTIASVKMHIQACKGFSVKNQRLIFGGRELYRQDAMIKDYGVTNGKMLHLVLKLSELQVVTITTVSGKEHVFRIDKMKYVRDLKRRLCRKEVGLSSDEQHLVLRGKDLKDEMRIDELPLEEDAVVHLFLRSTVKVRSHAVGGDIELSVTAYDLKAEGTVMKAEKRRFANMRPMLQAGHVDSEIDHFYTRKKDSMLEVPASIYGLSNLTIPCVLLDLIQQVKAGLEQGHSPILSSEGSGGAYFMQDEFGADIVGVFKPMDEEPMAINNPRGLPVSQSGEGLKRGTKVGEGALREVAAYILDHPADGCKGQKITGFAGVPPTVIIKCSHQVFQRKEPLVLGEKVGSLQLFVHASSTCEDMGPARFPVHEVHKIAVLDIRLANTDRNGANILVCKKGETYWNLVPIDHGYCLPDKFEDCTFEWLYWPQAKQPFDMSTRNYIAQLDAEADIALLEEHGWKLSAGCARVLRVATMLLKKGAAAGLTAYEIGSMMCRETLTKPSPIEMMQEDADGCVLTGISEDTFLAAVSVIMDKYIQAALLQRDAKGAMV